MYMESYSEGRIPHRLIFNSWNAALVDVNKWIDKSNVSISVWKYKELEQKKLFNPNIGKTYNSRMGPNYNTAIIDKMFFDFDCVGRDGKYIRKPYESMVRLWKWAEKNDYKRDMAFTGGGYQGTVSVKCLSENYVSVMRHLEDELDLEFDSVSLADLRRVVGSYNFGKKSKSKRNRFCIPLTEDEIELPFDTHKELALHQRQGMNIYGYNIYNPPASIKEYRKRELTLDPNFSLVDGVDKILDHYGYMYEDVCECIRNIIEQPHVRHKQRLHIISYLKNIVGIEYGDMNILLPKLLDASHGMECDGGHSVREGQVVYVYSSNSGFSPRLMKKEGYCFEDCDYCATLQGELNKIL